MKHWKRWLVVVMLVVLLSSCAPRGPRVTANHVPFETEILETIK